MSQIQRHHLCFDASAALSLVFADDPLHDAAREFVATLDAGIQICSPAMFAYEVDSAIRLRVWNRRLTSAEAQTARIAIAALQVIIKYDARDRDRAFEIAQLYDQPRAYDASYAAHAEARGVELITADAPFYEAVNGNKKPKNAPALSWVKLLQND